MATGEYPNLLSLCQAYFHQDWECEAKMADGIVAVFALENGHEACVGLIAEIDQLLSETDDRIAEIIDALGPFYLPSVDGLMYRQWLISIQATIRRALG